VTAPRERDLRTGPRGLRLRLREHGPVDGPPVVVLHGYLEQSAAWDDVALRLTGRRVVAPDHRGHGRSEHVGPGGFYHFWDYVADAVSVLDDLGPPLDLVGHSMGGSIAALVAAVAPERVRSLVLIEGLGPPDGDDGAVRQARQALAHRLDPPTHRPVRDLDEAVERMRRANPDLPPQTARRMAVRAVDPTPDGQLLWSFDPLHRARSPQAFSARAFRAFLRAIRAPTLLIEGGASPVSRIPDLDERRDCLPDARRVILDGVGHNPHHTAPDQLAALILEHLDARR
jgi:pimeloyl-ACP methyl ester carboxylesterase